MTVTFNLHASYSVKTTSGLIASYKADILNYRRRQDNNMVYGCMNIEYTEPK